MRFEVYTDRVAYLARAMQEKLEHIKNNQRQMFRSIEDLDNMWEGDSHDAFKAQYQSDDQSVSELCNLLSTIIDDISSASRKYEECENNVRSLINGIRI